MPASEVMRKFAKGKLRSGSKHGPKVKSKRQATAIMLSEARAEGHKIPNKSARSKKRKKTRKSRR
jgi:hypothetical protein